MSAPSLFHESWYRVSKLKLTLRPNVVVKKRWFRGEHWYLLHDPFSNDFHRLTPQTYRFLLRLDGKKSVEERWQESLEELPKETPGQSEIIQLLSQLYQSNLLLFDAAPDSDDLFKKEVKQKKAHFRSHYSNILYLKFPLFDPDALLNRLKPLIYLLFSPPGFALWLAFLLYALSLLPTHFQLLKDQTEGILSLSNLPILYLCIIAIKAFHEFGHAFAVKRFGGEVHTMGIMLLIFNPIPYVDASDSWMFRSKWHRSLVGMSGVIFELFIASIALIVWIHTGEGTLHSVAYNVILISSVSTLVFNLNPLLKFDGYYIFADLIDQPNLHQHSRNHLKDLFEKKLFGVDEPRSEIQSKKEGRLLALFGLLSIAYKWFVFFSIMMLLADHFFAFAMVMLVLGVIRTIVKPLFQFIRYLLQSHRLVQHRIRAVGVMLSLVAAAFILLGVLPVPCSFDASGVLKATESEMIAPQVSGRLEKLLVQSGATVTPGQPLLQIQNEALRMQLREAEASLMECERKLLLALAESQPDLAPLQKKRESDQERVTRLREKVESLQLRATIGGVWLAPAIENRIGSDLLRGEEIGWVINPENFQLVSVVTQNDLLPLFSDKIDSYSVKLAGIAHRKFNIDHIKVVQMEQRSLPSEALSYYYGGEIAVEQNKEGELVTKEPFYEIYASLSPLDHYGMFQGRKGSIHFKLPNKPIGLQLIKKIRQTIQKRYLV